MIKCRRQFRLVYTNAIYIALNYRYTLYIEVAHTNYLAGSLNIYIGKTPVSNSSTLSTSGKNLLVFNFASLPF